MILRLFSEITPFVCSTLSEADEICLNCSQKLSRASSRLESSAGARRYRSVPRQLKYIL